MPRHLKAVATEPPAFVLPMDTEAEALLLGILLDHPEYVGRIRGYLLPEHFGNVRHQRIYEALVALDKAGTLVMPMFETADCVFPVRNWLKDNGELENAGGVGLLMDLIHQIGVGRAYNPHAYAEAILTAWQDRETYLLGDILRGEADASDKGRVVQARIGEIRKGATRSRGQASDEVASEFFNWLEAAPDVAGIIKTYTQLDNLIRFLEPGHFSIIAARPSTGKSTFLLQVALRNALEQISAGIISLEMQESRLYGRLICALSRTNSVALLKDKGSTFEEADWNRIAEAKMRLDAAPLRWGTLRRGATLEEVRAQISYMIEEQGCRLVVLDHMALIHAEGKNEEEKQRSRSRELANIAMAYPQAVLLVAAQINREGGKAEVPALHHLEGSGAIEQDAETIIILHAPAPDSGDPRNKIKAFVAKARDAELGWHEMVWEPHFYRIDWKH